MYYAFLRRPMINSKGVDTSILFGFTKMLIELLIKERPSHLAVAFDPPAKTFRHEAYSQYKANRSATPELVKSALEPLIKILDALNIPVVMMPGYEADDVIGSMAKQWEGKDNKIFMLTPDKDYGQLVSENVKVYKFGKTGEENQIIGVEDLCAHYGIKDPKQVIDILTIWGDSSDNIPGVKGIGEVGAKKLVGAYGSVDGIIENIDKLPAKQQEAIRQAMDYIQMSRFLVTIKTDINLPLKLEDLSCGLPNAEKLNEVFNEYEFSSLKKLMDQGGLLGNLDISEPETLNLEEKSKLNLLTKTTELSVSELYDLAKAEGEVALEVSSNIENPNESIVLVSSKEAYAVRSNNYDDLKLILEDKDIAKIAYNTKEYIKFFKDNSISLKGSLYDIEIMHYVINPERSHKDEILFKTYLNIDWNFILSCRDNDDDFVKEDSRVVDLFSLVDDSSVSSSNNNKSAECLAKELAIHAKLLISLKDKILEELEQTKQAELYLTIEEPLISVLADMEYTGVKIDVEHLKATSIELTKELNIIEKEAIEMAGVPGLNLSSTKQVGILLFETLNLNPKAKKSSKGNYSTDEETLREMSSIHPIIDKILEYRAIKKLLSTYIDNFPLLISSKTGKIHTTFNQALTATGRLSSNNPNLQNIPIRTERGKEIRKAFIPSNADGFIVSADYSQIELRLMAHLSADPHLVDAFNKNKDIHTATAAKVFNIEEDLVTKEQRSRAKVANFGIIYGISSFGLSQRLAMSRTASKELIEEYFKSYPQVKEYMNNMIEKGKTLGYVETIYGRKRFLPDINSKNSIVRSFNERNAINAPLQGSAADIIKLAMVNIFKTIQARGLKSKMILQVHDELVFDTIASELEDIKTVVKQEMENVIKLKVPLLAECGFGLNWLEAH